MTIYILLLIFAVLAYGIAYWLIRNNKLPAIASWIVLLGTFTAFLALLISQTMSFWYALLVMLGLSFAMAVLLAKYQESQNT